MTDDENVLIQLRRTYEKDEMVSFVIRRMKELKVEIGQANSEIDHLNNELRKLNFAKSLNDELSREARIEAKKEEIYLKCREEIKALQDKLKRIGKDNQDLIQKLVSNGK